MNATIPASVVPVPAAALTLRRELGRWDLVGKGGHVRTGPVPTWVKAARVDERMSERPHLATMQDSCAA